MGDSGKAVFLSYASQDAEAARRIAESLRAAGVEVWFDQNELVGGDQWDAKIRGQIASCALFVPIISANTQARVEGYFRLEWKLAVDRSHLLADDHPFLFPIVIGDVSDAAARVPDKFREVQWTRLRLDETPAELAKRVTKLLNTEPGARSEEPVETGRKRRKRDSRPAWLRYSWQVIGLIFVVYYAMGPIWKPWFRDNGVTSMSPAALPTANPAKATTVATPTVSEARQLVDKAYALIHELDSTREDFALAEDYCQRAIKLDPDDGEVWAVYSQVNAAFGYRGWDRSLARREQTRVMAERAIRLAPRSVNARLAQAGAWGAFGINRDEQERMLREIVREEPDNQSALHFLAGILAAKPGGLEECLALNEHSAALPEGDPLALFNNARYLWNQDRPAEAYAVLLRSLKQRPFSSAWVFKMAMEIGWRGDLAAAEATLRQIPESTLQEDRANYFAGLLRYYQRNAAAALEIWQAFPRDYYSDNLIEGPKGLLLGLAYDLDHRAAAARSEWLAALQLVEDKIATAPNKPAPYYSQAYLLACLGERAKAGAALRTYEQLVGLNYTAEQPMPVRVASVYARLGSFDEIFAHPPIDSLNSLRFSPDFDPLRADPRFQQLLAERAVLDAKPPNQDPAGVSPSSLPALSEVERARSNQPRIDPKSVAVLAFANLSEDKANEYFSDGISEELLNVLAKVGGLKVTARTSAFFFKGKQVPLAEIAQQLGVTYVVEGSVRKQGDRVRISAQLIKASDGFNVWSDSFDRDLKDIFAVQDEIAGRIASELSSRLGVATKAISGTGGTKSVEAYEAFLKGRAAWNQRSFASNQEAVRYFQRAIALDPGYALAHGALAEAYVMLSITGIESADKVFPLAKASAERALELDPNIVQAYTALAEYYFHYAGDYAESDRKIDRAIAVDPNYAVAYSRYSGHLICRNRLEEALAMDERSIALNPLGPEASNSWTLLCMRRYDEALESARRESAPDRFPMSGRETVGLIQFLTGHAEEAVKTLEVVVRDFPEEIDPLTYLGWVYGQAGQTARARETLQRMMAMGESRYVSALELAKVAAGMNDREQAFAQLERAFARREPELPTIGASPFFDPIRDDPRFREMLVRLKLDAYFPESTKP